MARLREQFSVRKKVRNHRDKEGQDAGNREKERRPDEECGDAAALGCRRGNAEGHDEGVGYGFKELHGVPILIVGACPKLGFLNGTKVTLPMGA